MLVVEDDALIQTLIDQALCDGGYEPAIVASGEEAVSLLQGNPQHYRALVSDINLMGTMDGWDTAGTSQGRRERSTRPFPSST